MKISMTLQFFCYKHSMLLKKEKKQLCTKKYICRQTSDIAATLDAVFFSFRSNCLQMFYKIGVLIDFASHEKHLWWSFCFLELYWERISGIRCFPVIFIKCLRRSIMLNTSELLLLCFEEVIIQNHEKNIFRFNISDHKWTTTHGVLKSHRSKTLCKCTPMNRKFLFSIICHVSRSITTSVSPLCCLYPETSFALDL